MLEDDIEYDNHRTRLNLFRLSFYVLLIFFVFIFFHVQSYSDNM